MAGEQSFAVQHHKARRALDSLLPTPLRGKGQSMRLRVQSLPARSLLNTSPSPDPDVHIVLRGWVGTRATISESLQRLCHLSIRGDCVGLGRLSSLESDAPADAHMTLTPVHVVSLPVRDLHVLTAQHHEWRRFILDEILRQLRTHHLLHAVTGSMVAHDRLIHLIYLMACRHRAATLTADATIPLPLTQGEIGQVLGLTNVSVNRAFRTLEGKKMIISGRHSVTLLDESAWVPRLEFDFPHAELGHVYGRHLDVFN